MNIITQQDGETQKKEVNHASIKVSWIQKDDKSHSLTIRYYKK